MIKWFLITLQKSKLLFVIRYFCYTFFKSIFFKSMVLTKLNNYLNYRMDYHY